MIRKYWDKRKAKINEIPVEIDTKIYKFNTKQKKNTYI